MGFGDGNDGNQPIRITIGDIAAHEGRTQLQQARTQALTLYKSYKAQTGYVHAIAGLFGGVVFLLLGSSSLGGVIGLVAAGITFAAVWGIALLVFQWHWSRHQQSLPANSQNPLSSSWNYGASLPITIRLEDLPPEDVGPVLGAVAASLAPAIPSPVAQAAQDDLPRCPYCGDAIQPNETVRICSSCQTPHHRDCWDANKGCTTLGCSNSPSRC